jgi:hypothetical protein
LRGKSNALIENLLVVAVPILAKAHLDLKAQQVLRGHRASKESLEM